MAYKISISFDLEKKRFRELVITDRNSVRLNRVRLVELNAVDPWRIKEQFHSIEKRKRLKS